MKKAPEKYRLTKNSIMASNSDYGNNGFFIIPHYKVFEYFINCQISDGSVTEGSQAWEHVSVTISSKKRKVERCPTWEEMCFVKDLFWAKDEVVVQYHPGQSDYVNMHLYCLHLWKPSGVVLPVPDSIMIGKI